MKELLKTAVKRWKGGGGERATILITLERERKNSRKEGKRERKREEAGEQARFIPTDPAAADAMLHAVIDGLRGRSHAARGN